VRRAILGVACAALIAGCGDGGETTTVASTQTTSTTTTSTEPSTTTASTTPPEPGGAADSVAAVTAVLTSEGTAEQACGTYVTENFIQTAYGGKENCIASRDPKALAEGLSLPTGIEKNATHLVVIPVGGPYDGAKVEVDLVREGDTYRVEALEAHVPAGP
jgi:hypothetical protein